jgi:hypothetical protein
VNSRKKPADGATLRQWDSDLNQIISFEHIPDDSSETSDWVRGRGGRRGLSSVKMCSFVVSESLANGREMHSRIPANAHINPAAPAN